MANTKSKVRTSAFLARRVYSLVKEMETLQRDLGDLSLKELKKVHDLLDSLRDPYSAFYEEVDEMGQKRFMEEHGEPTPEKCSKCENLAECLGGSMIVALSKGAIPLHKKAPDSKAN
jgi:hypothetical protein